MDGLYRRKCWVKVLRSSLTPQDKIFSTRFHYKIKRKDGQFEKCKVRLVIQGQHMRRKDDTGLGDFEGRKTYTDDIPGPSFGMTYSLNP